MSTIIESIEQRQLRKDIPRFKAGDTVRVHFQVIGASAAACRSSRAS